METRRRKSISGDKFSFPIIIPLDQHEQDFEFKSGCITPGSPDSPADHLFFNGKLLPHSFPLDYTKNSGHLSRSASRTSSVSSKDSWMSSRSNSTCSRSSSTSGCSSARTSTSEVCSERRLTNSLNHNHQDRTCHVSKIPHRRDQNYFQNKPVLSSSSQRYWQFIVTPALSNSLNRQVSSSSRSSRGDQKSHLKRASSVNSSRSWFGRRILWAFVSACKECHAIKPSKDEVVLPDNLKLRR